MNNCPACQKALNVEALAAGRCPHCHRLLETPAAPPDERRYMQTVDSSSLPIDLDSDTIEYESSPQASSPAREPTPTVDGSSLPQDFSDQVPPSKPAYNQTVDAASFPAASDSDSIDVTAPSRPAERNINQTVDASSLPLAMDTDSVDVPVVPAESFDAGIGRTVDSVNIDLSVDSDSVAGAPPGHGTVVDRPMNQTIEATTVPNFDQEPNDPRATIDSVNGPPVKSGTVSERAHLQTVDSIMAAGEQPGSGTVPDRNALATLDSADIPDGKRTATDRPLAATYDSSVIADDPRAMDDMWGGDQNDQATPRMTVKGREKASQAIKSTLVIQRRAFREVKPELPSTLDADYDLIKMLGQGGMGVVYAARQASIDRTVAIKMLKPNMTGDAVQRNKFLAEAVITGDLDHPNIVPIYDLGKNDEGALFYAMKCVKGTPWDEAIQKKSLVENLEILLKVCDAVAFGHSRGVIHRDLKPENTMLGGFGEVLVMDWGLALPFGKFEKSRSITPSASMGGTPAYMAPEMATGPFDKMGPSSDIYLLGAILYEIITGSPPHRGKDVMKCLFAAAKNQIVPTDKTGELVEIALKAMATDPAKRFATVQDFQAAIRGYQEHSESISMSSRAGDELQRAVQADDYNVYSRAVFGFEEAYALWDGNHKAAQGVIEAKLAYAKSALRKGDFDLGSSLLDPAIPEHANVAAQIEEARREREAKQHRLKAAKRAVITLAAVIFVTVCGASGVFYMLKKEADQQRDFAVAAEKTAVAAEKSAVAAKLVAVEAEQEAKKQKGIAEENAREATKQRDIAFNAKEDATNQRDIARKQEQEAKRQEGIARKAEAEAKYEAYIALIGLAAAKIDENAFGHARELLNHCDKGLRNWEWGRLMHICNQSVVDYDTGAPVDAIAFSRDGQYFVTGGWNGTLGVWNVTGERLIDLPQGSHYVQAVAVSPTARQIAIGSNDKTGYVRLWDLETRQPLREFQGHTDGITSVTFSRDGQRLLTTSYDNTARLWNVATGELVRSYEGHSWWVWDAAFAPDEATFVTASQDGTALIWNVATGERSPPFAGHQGPVYSVAISPDGQFIATGGYDKQVLVWKPTDVQPFDYKGLLAGAEQPPPKYRILEGHGAAVRSVEFSPDGRFVLSAGHDNTAKLWNLEADGTVKTLRGHDSWVRACTFSPDGQWVLSAGHDKHARLWNIEGYEEVRVLRGRVLHGHEDAIMAVAFSHDGSQIATASRDRTAKSWDTRTGGERHSFREGHLFLASDAMFFPDNKRALTSAVDNTVRVWDLSTGVELLRLDQTGRAAAVAVSHDSRWVATGSDNRTAKLWDAESGELVHVFEGHKVEVTALAFSPDDRLVFTGDSNGRGVLWNRETGQELKRLSWHTSKIAAAAFHPSGQRLLTASDDKTVCQWDIRQLAENPDAVVPLTDLNLKHPDSVVSLDLSADGRRAITAALDNKVRVWDLEAGKLLHELFVPDSPISSAAISRDGRLGLSVHNEQRVVRVWNLETGQPLPGDAAASQDVFLDFNQLGGLVWSARFSNDGGELLTVGGNEARMWNLRPDIPARQTRELMSFSPHAAVASANFSPDGKWIVTASWDNSARIWNAETGLAERKLVGAHTGYVNSAVFSPNGEFVLTASDDRTAKLWNAQTGEVVHSFEGHAGRVRFAAFSPNGNLILTASDDKTARIWDRATGELQRELQGHEWGVLSAAFSGDGKMVVTGSDDNSARIWDATTGAVLLTLAGHTAAVTSVAFSPNGSRVLTASEDFTAKLWDAQTGKEILNLRGHSQEVTSVTFSDDGQYALTGSRDGTAILWLTEPWLPSVQGE